VWVSRPLTLVADLQQPAGEEQRVDQRLVSGQELSGLIQTVTGEVHVLIVDHNRGVEIGQVATGLLGFTDEAAVVTGLPRQLGPSHA
jgi:hypothetical protein